jgi:TolB protein
VGSWSPDGGFFAYSHSANGPLDIFIQATAGGDPVRLVESDCDDYPPAWSPDNRWIAFVSGRSGKNAIYLVSPLGGTVRHLTDIGYPPLYTADLTALGRTPWSPDGSRLVFARKEGSGAALWIIDVATGEETRLTGGPEANDGGAAWSFDGDAIAFIRITRGLFGIWVIPAQGGEPRQVYEGLEDYWVALGWAPDDRSVVFGSSREGSSTDLWAVEVDSGGIRRLTSGVSEKNGACVGRDGRVLMNDFTHQTDVYLQDIESGEVRRLTMHTTSNFEAQISPQGDRLAYMSDRSGNSEIVILDLETGREVQVTDHEDVDRSPSWSPDGRTMVFESTRSGERRLWSIDPEGRAARQLLERKGVWLPRFSPDGRAVGFLSSDSGTQSLWIVDPDGSSPRLVKEDVGDFSWYRDSRRIVYATASGDFTEIRAADLETGDEALVHEEPHLEIRVAPDGTALTYLSARSHYNMNLHLLRLKEGPDGLPRAAREPEKLTAGDGEWHVHNGGFAPDGKSVAYTRDTDTANVYMIEGLFPAVEGTR